MASVTTVRNLGAGGYIDVALRDAINGGDAIAGRLGLTLEVSIHAPVKGATASA